MIVSFERLHGLVTLQDGGRPGLRHLGIPSGGAADKRSALSANRLVGKLTLSPLLEFAQASGRLLFSEATCVSWTGAEVDMLLNGTSVPRNRRVEVAAGSTLQVQGQYRGRFGYLAIAGDWQVDLWRNSTSPIRIGDVWVPSSSVAARGNRLIIDNAQTFDPRVRSFAKGTSLYKGDVPFWPGPEASAYQRWLSGHPTLIAAGLPKLSEMRWNVMVDSNRVGLRLHHPLSPLVAQVFASQSIRSSPTLPGTIQVTPAGELIISLVDGPTMGGYPRIGLVPSEAIGAVAQLTEMVRLVKR